ncbi:Retrovirus-related Pol polyprotein from transposon RE1 [Vitis vinifera]|uniref:Retrovirus-related Pol polyprotein from transposon RE1 n=1 Tax=Vitis vinifera TaxID=29760 RepID=A0A438HJA6_VITVI|nr:Retrovirus-related Pol polyprotein from transposon RE1 [Vitis vinifera]
MLTRSKAGIFKKKAFLTTSPTIPQTFKQALVDQNWRATMDVKFQALLRNNIWTLVHHPPIVTLSDANGSLNSNTIQTTALNTIKHAWLPKLDVQNAFLNRELQEQVLMTQPPGFENHQTPDSVYCLNKALYGLKHASRAWFTKLIHYLITKGFQCSRANSSPFFQYSVIDMLLLLIYVDDILITGSNPSHVSSFIFDPSSPFALRDLGNLHNFLGVEVIQQSSTLHLNQCRYIQQFLKRNNMLNTKLANTPGALGKQLSTADGEFLSDASLYKSTVGALSYWKGILQHLKGASSHGLLFQASPSLTLQGYINADWASYPDDCRSTGGYCLFLGPNLISWSSTKQKVVSRSSVELEYRALASLTAEIVWVQAILKVLCISQTTPLLVWCDNKSTTALAANFVFHACSKHIKLDLHFIRDKVFQNDLHIQYTASTDQVADIFTKNIPSS